MTQEQKLQQALTSLLVQRSGLYDQMENSDKQVIAIQNTLAGVKLGRELATAEAEEARKQEALERLEEPKIITPE